MEQMDKEWIIKSVGPKTFPEKLPQCSLNYIFLGPILGYYDQVVMIGVGDYAQTTLEKNWFK